MQKKISISLINAEPGRIKADHYYVELKQESIREHRIDEHL